MNFSKIFFIGLLTLFSKTNADCNKCNSYSIACKNSSTFSICEDGAKMSENYGHCKTGTVCTDQATTCMPTGGTTVAACTATECNECSGRFKCTSQTTYDLCDSDKKTMASGKCDSGKVCSIAFLNLASKSICGTSCETTPTCSNTEIIPTVAPTTSTANYKESCNGITVKGNYAMKDDLQCKKYVYCEPTGTTGDIAAILLSCSADTYFDASKQKCVGEKPSTCT